MMNEFSAAKKISTIVIGGGQAGLAVGYHLAKRRLPFQILDANASIGDAWRKRWDSLRLFTPARYAGLPGLPFPAPGDAFPTKQQMADYLEAYAQHFRLPVQTGVKVERVSKQGDRFVVETSQGPFESEQVVIAMANYQTPRVPAFAPDLNPGIVQLHSHSYRNPSQLQKGGVLIVGAGNSGATPLIRVRPRELINAGIERVPRVVGVRDGQPLLSGGRTLDVANVIWCTGYQPGFSWIDLPIFGEDGRPVHERGIVSGVPGSVLCRLALSLFDDVCDTDRSGKRRRTHCQGDRTEDLGPGGGQGTPFAVRGRCAAITVQSRVGVFVKTACAAFCSASLYRELHPQALPTLEPTPDRGLTNFDRSDYVQPYG